jgi:bifunctional non-homologous end joining protein LigD
MLAQLARTPPSSGAWHYERKLDGLRMLAVRNGDRVELWSRGHQSFHERFPHIVDALARLPADRFTLDGEVVALEGDHTSFSLLQRPGSTAEPVYFVFDVLHLDGRDTSALSQEERTAALGRVIVDGPVLRRVETLHGDPSQLLSRACELGWEGVIAKRAGAPYRSGRSRDWLKLKCTASQELVVVGWTDPRGARTGLGALLVGYHEGDRLRYAGKVGTGFDAATLADLHRRLGALARETPPVDDPVRMRDAHWVEPRLVAEIAFTEWTRDGRLRHPSYHGLRPDKDPRSVVRELPLSE